MSFRYIANRYNADSTVEKLPDETVYTGGIPADILRHLECINRYGKEQNAGIYGSQYAYRRFESGGNPYYVLSCIRDLADEGTGRTGFTAHHILLTEDEVAGFHGEGVRATPAGLILAMEATGMWLSPCTEESLSGDKRKEIAAAIPDAKTSGAWKELTGDAALARILYTEPYNKECLILLPTTVHVQDALLLLHESDSTHEAHGWDRTFTTYGTAEDNITDTRRIILPICTYLIAEEGWKDLPILCINDRLKLATDVEETVYEDDGPRLVTHTKPERTHPENPEQYHYREVPDSQIFNVPFRRIFKLLGAAIILLLLVAVIGVALLYTSRPEAAPTATGTAVPTDSKSVTKKAPPQVSKRLAFHPGLELPADLFATKADQVVNVTIQPLTLAHPQVKGTLKSVRKTAKGYLLYVTDKAGATHCATIEAQGGVLQNIRFRNKAAALDVSADDREYVLVPVIQVALPEIPADDVPEIPINLTPEDLWLENGALHCRYLPELDETAPVRLKHTPVLILPSFPACRHNLIGHSGQGVPFETSAELYTAKGGLYKFRLQLHAYHPYRQYFTQDFDTLANLQTPSPAPGAPDVSMAGIIELARQMAQDSGNDDLRAEYNTLRQACLRDIPLPAYHGGQNLSVEIAEAVCAKMSRDLQDCVKRLQEDLAGKSYSLVLELETVYFDTQGNTLHWVFLLRLKEKQPTPPAP